MHLPTFTEERTRNIRSFYGIVPLPVHPRFVVKLNPAYAPFGDYFPSCSFIYAPFGAGEPGDTLPRIDDGVNPPQGRRPPGNVLTGRKKNEVTGVFPLRSTRQSLCSLLTVCVSSAPLSSRPVLSHSAD